MTRPNPTDNKSVERRWQMNVSETLRISASVIVGLYAVFVIFASNPEYRGPLGLVFIPFVILIAAGIMFLAWKRPLAGGLVALFLALLLFLIGTYQSIDIFGAKAGAFILINLVLDSPLLLAGVLLLAAHRVKK